MLAGASCRQTARVNRSMARPPTDEVRRSDVAGNGPPWTIAVTLRQALPGSFFRSMTFAWQAQKALSERLAGESACPTVCSQRAFLRDATACSRNIVFMMLRNRVRLIW